MTHASCHICHQYVDICSSKQQLHNLEGKKDQLGQQHLLSKPVQEGLEPVTTSRVLIDAPMLIGFLSWSSKELIKSWCKVSAEPGEHFAYGTQQTGGW